MLAGDFQAKLRRINPKLRIFAGDDPKRAAAIYDPADPEIALVGIDKNYVYEWPRYDATGRMVSGGWRRAITILIKTGYVDKRKAQQVFGTEFNAKRPKVVVADDPIRKAVDEIRNHAKANRLDVQDVAQMIRKSNG